MQMKTKAQSTLPSLSRQITKIAVYAEELFTSVCYTLSSWAFHSF